MHLNVLNDLAEAMKALGGKKDLDSSWLFSDFEQRNLLITRHSSFEGLLLLRASLGMTKASGGAQVKDNANLGRDLEVALIHFDWSWLILIDLDSSWLFSDFEQRNLLIARHSSFEGLLLLRASLGMTKASGGAQVKDNANLGRDLEVALIHLDWSWLILIRLDSFQTLNKETYWLLDIRPLKVCCYFERPWAWQRLREERR